jgi:surfeit locus 1 family protein
VTGAGRIISVVIGGLAVLILLALGTWQVQRLNWKTELIAKVEDRMDAEPIPLAEALARLRAGDDIEYLPVAAVGGFPSDRVVHVFGTHDGRPGAFVFQAMRLDDGGTLLINRGFVPQDERRTSYPLPNAGAFTGLVRFYEGETGVARAVNPGETDGTLFTRDREVLLEALTGEVPNDALPFALDSTLPTAIPEGRTTRLAFRNAHLGYAITWYGLAIALIVVMVLRLRRRED